MINDANPVRELSKRTVEMAVSVGAEQAEALCVLGSSALTRFANNGIHQNVASEDEGVAVRAVMGKRVGVASTNRTDDESLRACCEAAVEAARHAPEDPDFPGLPEPRPVVPLDRVAPETCRLGAEQRAEAVSAIIEESTSRSMTAAGQISTAEEAVAVSNSLGVDAAMATTTCRASVLSMGPDEGAGWSSFAGRDCVEMDPVLLGERAASLGLRSAKPQDLAPGIYTVVLAPDAVAELVQFLGWYGGSAKTVEEGRSFMSGHMGHHLMSDLVSVIDDAMAPEALGLTFDYEGMPKTRVALVEKGTIGNPVTDSYWAAKTGRPDTGHALPAGESFGPIPLDLRMSPGEASADSLIASVDNGIYVTRFHYVNIEDPIRATLTGMTRDGTFMIEHGRLTTPLRNLRFTQSAVEALAHTGGVSAERRMVGEQGVLAPYLLLDQFSFTGQTR